MSGAFENRLLRVCGAAAPKGTAAASTGRLAAQRPAAGAFAPGTDILVNDPTLDVGGSTQSETSVVAVGNTICAAWNDSGEGFGANGFSGHGVSTDGGATFADKGFFPNGPFDSNFGDPSLAFSVRDNTYYYAALSTSGLSMWRSIDGCQSFTYVGVIHFGFADDKEMIAVDNSPTSPFFGRIYVGWTDFFAFPDINASLHSDNGGLSWSPEVFMPGSGSTGQAMWPAVAPNGDVYMAALNVAIDVGDLQEQRIYRSLDGGFSFAQMTPIGSGQLRPEDQSASFNCGRQALTGNVRDLSSPQIVITADPTTPVGYVINAVYPYDSDGEGPDHSNVFYRRSIDGANSWSSETRLNDDNTATDQFFPSITANENGVLVASWYDRRLDPANNLGFDRFMTFSLDGGQSWNENVRVSDVTSPVAQTLPNFDGLAPCYHGDYDQVAAVGNVAHIVWSDDRRITGTGPNPDVYYDQVVINPELGRLLLAHNKVSCSATISVTLSDSDLIGTGTHDVAATTNEGDSETMTLTEVVGKPGTFTGSITTASGPIVVGDGVLQVQDQDVVTITYQDANDGTGNPRTTTALVSVDCVGPTISNVHSTFLSVDTVNVAIDSSEPAGLTVNYGADCGALVQTASSSGLSQSPSVNLAKLGPGVMYFFAVVATDEAGNATTDDNGGACYTFTTPDVIFQANFEKDDDGFTFDNNFDAGNGLWHRSSACASAIFGHTIPHSLYYGQDSTCTYNNGLTNAGVAISPVITLPVASFATLDLNYFLGNEGGSFFDQAAVEVSVNGGPFQVIDSSFSRIDDEDPNVRTRPGVNPAGGFSLTENTAKWQHASVDLSPLLPGSGSATLQIRFRFETIDPIANDFAGFYVDDIKVSGVVPPKACTSDGDCDDGLFCDGVETCKSGFCSKGLPIVCPSTDNVDCTEDLCDETTKGCVNKPNDAKCDDGTFCDGVETCNPVTGCQPATTNPCADDGIACTFDTCNEAIKLCSHIPEDFLCNDGLFCDGVETCNPTVGCVSSGFPCNDGVDCTDDTCSEFTGCANTPNNAKCDDGLFCTGVESCQPGFGCVTTGDPCPGPDICSEQFQTCVPSCFTDTNTNHAAAGRAYNKSTSYFALGSNDALGKAAVVTSLQGSGGTWHKVASCPVPPTIVTLNAAVVGDTVTVSGATSDANNDVTVVKVTISSGFAPPITVNASGTTSFSAGVALVPGDYTATAQAFDASGLSSAVTPPISFTVFPLAPPHLDSIAVSVNSINVTVTGTASDINNDISFVEITILQNGNVVASTTATGTTGWTGSINTLLPGVYSARAQAFDAANFVSNFSTLVPFTVVDRCVIDTNANQATAGRAVLKSGVYRALGSNDSLGKGATTLSALQGSGGFWKKVTTCPVPQVVVPPMSPASSEPLVSMAP